MVTNHCPSVLWHCCLGHLTHKLVPWMACNYTKVCYTGLPLIVSFYQYGNMLWILVSCHNQIKVSKLHSLAIVWEWATSIPHGSIEMIPLIGRELWMPYWCNWNVKWEIWEYVQNSTRGIWWVCDDGWRKRYVLSSEWNAEDWCILIMTKWSRNCVCMCYSKSDSDFDEVA